jgi:hydrogenase-4 component E
MMEAASTIIVKILFVLILGTAAMIIMQKTLATLFSLYRTQSLLIAVVALVVFISTGSYVLLALCIVTIITKVIIIPYMLHKIRKDFSTKRDAEFRYLTPVTAILVAIILVIVVYNAFLRVLPLSQDNLFFLGAVIGVSLALIGMIVIFSRKKVVTKVVGYLTMENGILLFGIFMAELPLIIELLIIVDLIIFILLTIVLAFGIESAEDEFHLKLNMFTDWLKK